MTTPDYDQARRARDRRMRRDLLRALDAAKAAGGMRGRMLADVFNASADFQDDDQVLALLHDLVNSGYAAAADLRTKHHQRQDLDHTSWSITAAGTALIQQAVEPDPLIEDDRPPRK